MPHTTIWLDKKTYTILKEKCKELNKSEGLLIREALNAFLGRLGGVENEPERSGIDNQAENGEEPRITVKVT